jgi:hypothetical protein
MFSALPLKPDIAKYGRHVRFVPILLQKSAATDWAVMPFVKGRGFGFRNFHGRDGPSTFVACDRNSQAVQFVQEDPIDCPRLPVRQHHCLTNEVNPRLLEVAKDGKGYFLSG